MKITIEIPDEKKRKKLPMKKGERLMYATLGRSGGIFAFTDTAWKAKEIRDQCFTIGKKNPKRYLVSFREKK